MIVSISNSNGVRALINTYLIAAKYCTSVSPFATKKTRHPRRPNCDRPAPPLDCATTTNQPSPKTQPTNPHPATAPPPTPPSFPRKREPRAGARRRGVSPQRIPPPHHTRAPTVLPAKAGIQRCAARGVSLPPTHPPTPSQPRPPNPFALSHPHPPPPSYRRKPVSRGARRGASPHPPRHDTGP